MPGLLARPALLAYTFLVIQMCAMNVVNLAAFANRSTISFSLGRWLHLPVTIVSSLPAQTHFAKRRRQPGGSRLISSCIDPFSFRLKRPPPFPPVNVCTCASLSSVLASLSFFLAVVLPVASRSLVCFTLLWLLRQPPVAAG